MLDTNVAIHLRDRDTSVIKKVALLDRPILISVITRVELENGIYSDPDKVAIRKPLVDAILKSIPTLPFDDDAADVYRSILESTGFSRRKILNRMIAAQALAHPATLVTLNPSDFADVPGLELIAW